MRALRLAILSAVLAATRAASAQSHPMAQLEYARDAGAASCPDEAAVRAAVIARLGYDPFAGATAAATRVRASITRHGRALRASIELHRPNASQPGRERTREITSRAGDCDELARAMSLAIGIAIDPLVLSRPEPATTGTAASSGSATPASGGPSTRTGGPPAAVSAPPPVTGAPPAAVSAPPTVTAAPPSAAGAPPPVTGAPPAAVSAPPRATGAPPAVAGAPPPRSAPPPSHPAPSRRPLADPLRLRIGLGLEGQFGFEPSVAPGARVVLGGRIRRFGVDLELRGALPNAISYMGGTVSVSHAGAVALACAHEIPVPWLTACALVSGSVLFGTGSGYPAPQLAGTTRVLGPLVGLGARLGVEVPLGRLVALFANGEIAWVPTRGTFQIAPASAAAQGLTAYSTPGFDVVAGAGVLVHFR